MALATDIDGTIDEAEDQVGAEERPEVGEVGAAQQGYTADDIADGEEALGREIAVRKLVGEEDAQDRGDAPCAADKRLLPRLKA
jgi:hypothetical protein